MTRKGGDPNTYFAQRDADLRAQGLDPDDDEVWCRPDNEQGEPELGGEW